MTQPSSDTAAGHKEPAFDFQGWVRKAPYVDVLEPSAVAVNAGLRMTQLQPSTQELVCNSPKIVINESREPETYT